MERISRVNALLETLRASPGRVGRILVQEGTKNPGIVEILRLAGERGIPVERLPRKRLERIDRRHQGVVGFIAPRGYTPLETILQSGKPSFLVLLDGIEDPQNLGAIIRTSEGAGVDGIILPERRAAGLTGAVYTVSAGAAEHVPVARVKNLARAMQELKDRGVWLVGAEGGREDPWYAFDYRLPVGLVFGSEGKGLRPLIRKRCDRILSLPLMGKTSSLNVAAAAAVFLYEVVRQRGWRKDKKNE